MMSLILLSVFFTSAFASGISPAVLFRRQSSCDAGYKVCGQVCIDSTYTCCPDLQGGCPSTENCQLGSNGAYGCCPKGDTCTGTGGVRTDTAYITSSYTYTTSRSVQTSATAVVTGTSSTCDVGWKACGDYCIPSSWQCCPDLNGGCDPDVARCWLGTNGNYGCCANRYSSCDGAAGSATDLPSTYSDVVGSSTTTTSTTRTTSRTSSTPNPAGVSTTTRTTSSSATSRTTSATTSSASAVQLLSDGQQNNGPFASLLSLVMAFLALAI